MYHRTAAAYVQGYECGEENVIHTDRCMFMGSRAKKKVMN